MLTTFFLSNKRYIRTPLMILEKRESVESIFFYSHTDKPFLGASPV
jgi:hypothetical protein